MASSTHYSSSSTHDFASAFQFHARFCLRFKCHPTLLINGECALCAFLTVHIAFQFFNFMTGLGVIHFINKIMCIYVIMENGTLKSAPLIN